MYGRTIGAGEMRAIGLAERVVHAFETRANTEWAAWSEANPEQADLLGLALREAIDLGLIDE